jgi:hypothetical protein
MTRNEGTRTPEHDFLSNTFSLSLALFKFAFSALPLFNLNKQNFTTISKGRNRLLLLTMMSIPTFFSNGGELLNLFIRPRPSPVRVKMDYYFTIDAIFGLLLIDIEGRLSPTA